MLQIVKMALKRPHTIAVMVLLILLSGVISLVKTPTDIFPDIKIPVIAVVWTYTGLSPDEMAGRVVYYYERQLTSNVNDIDHIESQSLNGVGVVKIFFRSSVDIRTATAQVTSVSQTVLKQMPPGITPPLILNYNASTVPILQLALSSPDLGEQKIFDAGQNFIRPALATVQGAATPSPYGGKVRQIQIDLDPSAMASKGLSAQDIETALAAQNQIIPVGVTKIGGIEYTVKLNDSPKAIDELNRLPVKVINSGVIFLGDVAHVRDGSPPQTNIVRMEGRRAVLMSILKTGSASTIAIVDDVKQLLPRLQETLPASLKVLPLSDQSVFVKAAISGVVREGALAALFTSLMILLFLGSWRSTVIIAISIPLAVLSSIAMLAAFGQTLNIMTLGGLSLAVGILVDDATVTIENINWHLERGSPVTQAILDGAAQIVGPAFVSLLCICTAFLPMFFLGGVAGFLFAPMALAVIFAMVASFLLSRTLVPSLANFLLRDHAGPHTLEVLAAHDAEAGAPKSKNPLVHIQHGFEARFERFRSAYRALLVGAVARRKTFIPAFLALTFASFLLIPFLGRTFFPAVDGGQISLHVRAPLGSRIEETAALFDQIEMRIRHDIPSEETGAMIDNIGLTVSATNVAYANSGTIGPQDGDLLVSLREGHHPTAAYVKKLRQDLPNAFPGVTFSFLPADMVSQILNFGSPAPLDIAISGPDKIANEVFAQRVLRDLRTLPGIADVRLQQSAHYPQLAFNVDRTRASQLGLTERDVTNALAVNLSGSGQLAPAFWLNPKTGVSYPIVAQAPQYRVDSLSKLRSLPITGSKTLAPQVLGALGTLTREDSDAVVSHYAIQPSQDIYATTEGQDLGAVADQAQKVLDRDAAFRPRGALVSLHGQVQTMNDAFVGLLLGLAGAIVLIYLLIVVNFQSWSDPFIIVTALPAALAGIVWILFLTHTPLSVPALTGAIMCMGVATANSVLVISFAREKLAELGNASVAAVEAGFTRFRPVLMTALAMIIGMTPMALGLGEGGEQNAPLGRAVIGGLLFATVATLIFVPVVFSLVHRDGRRSQSDLDLSGDAHDA